MAPCRAVSRKLTSIPSDVVFPFLAPSIQPPKCLPYAHIAGFSTSLALQKRDNNRNRGVSVKRHTGLRPRQTLSVRNVPLPKPVLDPSNKNAIIGDENHGLWGFFKDKKLLMTPNENWAHGRAWTAQELHAKSWDDLHALWWVCVKERNRLTTENATLKRQDVGYGEWEIEGRDKVVVKTMKAIREALIERWNAWEDARKLAEDDPEINLEADTAKGEQVYTASLYETSEFEEEVRDGTEKQDNKQLPSTFYNTTDTPPDLKERIKQKLFNKK
ncbi:MRP-L47-domain-containing protein [Lindgomyces ingoldianus]|uniref:MRP-L47-domain-containing protein n=1 Tax=Lindgomyces ingoldianus TaxID=673940 RepID=A0ACB6R8P0_9PLEO|nr:MRP-L47-domain-containing protein [Lindgomyces ingoldianus]KAF2475648.1 MRP-L47-domain-containing protein [Lindgomyces ingoldianus]